MQTSLKCYGNAEKSEEIIADFVQQNSVIRYEHSSAASRLYDRYVQQLFNYGMHICGNREAVKESLIRFFIKVREENGLPGKRISTRCQMFKKFRMNLVEWERFSNAHQENESIPRLSRWEYEATFLKLHCGFNYGEVAAIMVVGTKTARSLVSQAFETMAEQMETASH